MIVCKGGSKGAQMKAKTMLAPGSAGQRCHNVLRAVISRGGPASSSYRQSQFIVREDETAWSIHLRVRVYQRGVIRRDGQTYAILMSEISNGPIV